MFFYLKSQDSLEEIRPRAPTRALPWTHLLGGGLQHHHHPPHTPPQPIAVFLPLDFSFKLNIFTKSSDSFFFRNKPTTMKHSMQFCNSQFSNLVCTQMLSNSPNSINSFGPISKYISHKS